MAARRGGLLCLPLALALLVGGGSSSSISARAAGPLPAASSEAFDSVLGNTASCHRACQLTYSLHTYPKVRAGPASRLPEAAAAGRAPRRARSVYPQPHPGSRAEGLAGGTAPASPSPGLSLASLPPLNPFLCSRVTGHRRDFLGQEPLSRHVPVHVFSSGAGRVFKRT